MVSNKNRTKSMLISFNCYSFAYLNINISNEMIAQIVAYIHLFNFTIFIFAFNEYIFKKIIIMLLHFFVTDICNHWKNRKANVLKYHRIISTRKMRRKKLRQLYKRLSTYSGYHLPIWQSFVDLRINSVVEPFVKKSVCCEYVSSGLRVDMHRF